MSIFPWVSIIVTRRKKKWQCDLPKPPVLDDAIMQQKPSFTQNT